MVKRGPVGCSAGMAVNKNASGVHFATSLARDRSGNVVVKSNIHHAGLGVGATVSVAGGLALRVGPGFAFHHSRKTKNSGVNANNVVSMLHCEPAGKLHRFKCVSPSCTSPSRRTLFACAGPGDSVTVGRRGGCTCGCAGTVSLR